MPRPLGLVFPTDQEHLLKYPLSTRSFPKEPTPCVLGTPWYTAFDTPTEQDGLAWVGLGGDWGHVRGGHAICLLDAGHRDKDAWWRFYDQGDEGACAAFAASRAQTLNNLRTYDAFCLYAEAQKVDGVAGAHDGTTLRAVGQVLRQDGPRPKTSGRPPRKADPEDGISGYVWARSAEDTLKVLGYAGQTRVPFLNSWGTSWPHVCWLPAAALDRMFAEGAEVMVPLDKPGRG